MGNVNTPVVYTLEELKKIHDETAYGIRGQWGTHAKLHEGHKTCAELVNSHCDWVLGVMWNNTAGGQRFVLGKTEQVDDENIIDIDLEYYKEKSDVVLVLKGDYHPYKNNMNYILGKINKLFPEKLLKEIGIYNNINSMASLYYSSTIRITMHEFYKIKTDYQVSCGREAWRVATGYADWLQKEYGHYVDLIDPIKDDFDNCLSGRKNSLPKEWTDRIQKPLLLSHFRTTDDVLEQIKNIEGLNVSFFIRKNNWIHAQFYFYEPKNWWAEGLKLE